MSAVAQGTVSAPPRPVGRRRVALLAGSTVLAVAPYLAGILVPYYVNDLDVLPLAEVSSGAYDPKDLWPQGPLAGLTQLAGLLAISLTPLGLLAVLTAALTGLAPRRRRSAPVVTAGLALVALSCLAALAFYFSPMGAALMSWRLD
ncbi:hypothetical protein IN07_07525 [Modestobacter caceresii]|uniref:Uncharacterized protein n=1 Tax=Modestobacter caceresii TaxID=1522368 RepID=A0A098Y8P6_9ACTN|nr:hypothetical protein [Modestobacter caceresii]KGH47243.1 hypothetical protein IN07_07525 [Modestobacter caceresii]